MLASIPRELYAGLCYTREPFRRIRCAIHSIHRREDQAMPFDYSDKVVLITGAGSGFGELAARKFSEAGARLFVADVNRDALDTLAKELGEGGAEVTAIACDVSKEEEVRSAIEAAVKAYGALDVAINNAGVTHTISRLADLPVSELDRQYAVNIRGVFLCMKYEIPQMLEQGRRARWWFHCALSRMVRGFGILNVQLKILCVHRP